jgi:hypothetical protein
MSHFKKSLTSLVLILLPVIVSAQTCQTASIPATTPTSRFTVNSNGTVADTKTGLMWKKCSEGQSGTDCSSGEAATYTWQQALQQAQTVNSGGFAGYSDWRVPNVKELVSITEKQCVYPAINLTVFPNTPSVWWFWSSSPYADNSGDAWIVYFENGVSINDGKGSYGYVRLVR